MTIDAKPVRAPSPTPDADSIYEVFDEIPAAPPAAAAIESTIRILFAFATLFPSCRRNLRARV